MAIPYKPLLIIRDGTSVLDGTPDPINPIEISGMGLIQPLKKGEGFVGQSGEQAEFRLFTPVGFKGIYNDRIEQGGEVYVLISNIDVEGVTGIKAHHQELLLARFKSGN